MSPACSSNDSDAPSSARSMASVVCPPPGSDRASFTSSSALRELRISLAPRAANAVAIALPKPPVAPVRSAVLPLRSMYGTYLWACPDLQIQEQHNRRRREDQDENGDGDETDDRRGSQPSTGPRFWLRQAGRLRRVWGSSTRRDTAAGLETGGSCRLRIRRLGSHAPPHTPLRCPYTSGLAHTRDAARARRPAFQPEGAHGHGVAGVLHLDVLKQPAVFAHESRKRFELPASGVGADPLLQNAEQLLVDVGLVGALRLQVECGPAADDDVASSFDLHRLEQLDGVNSPHRPRER